MFGPATAAEIYVKEIRTRLDPLMVAVFPPDERVTVGDFGLFEDGRWRGKGNLHDRGLRFSAMSQSDADAAAAEGAVDPAFVLQSASAAGFSFASNGKVKIGATTTVKALQGDMAKALISFTRGKAVIASYDEGTRIGVRDEDTFADEVVGLWQRGDIPPNRLVVSGVHTTCSGTVIVAQEGGSEVEVLVDPALTAGAVNVASLRSGVEFGADHQGVWTMSQGPMTVSVRLLGYTGRGARDVFGFDTAPQPVTGGSARFTTDHLMRQLSDAAAQEQRDR
jgi:hypothetical protein